MGALLFFVIAAAFVAGFLAFLHLIVSNRDAKEAEKAKKLIDEKKRMSFKCSLRTHYPGTRLMGMNYPLISAYFLGYGRIMFRNCCVKIIVDLRKANVTEKHSLFQSSVLVGNLSNCEFDSIDIGQDSAYIRQCIMDYAKKSSQSYRKNVREKKETEDEACQD